MGWGIGQTVTVVVTTGAVLLVTAVGVVVVVVVVGVVVAVWRNLSLVLAVGVAQVMLVGRVTPVTV